MRKNKILPLILSALMLGTCLTGCGSDSKEEAKTASSSSGEMDKSPITLTMFTKDSSEDIIFDDDVAKKITELTGVTLKITHPVAGDEQAIPLMIASGEYPDLIFAKGDTGKVVDAEALIPLDDYIEKEGDNLKELYGDQLKRLRYSADDQSIYTVGTYRVNSEVKNPDGAVQIQHAVLKDQGYPEIKTLEDYEKAIKAYKEKYPEINGQKTIGLSLMASDWRWLITCGNRAGIVAGIPNDGQWKVDDTTGEAVYKFELPECKEYFKWLCHMNAEGLLDPESFTQKEDTYKAKISQGIVLGLSDEYWDYDQPKKALQGSNMNERTYAPLSVTLNDECKDQTLKDYGFSGGFGVGISTSCQNKERAFQFLNWLASDEAQVLINWGIEGKHYEVVDGKRKFLPEVQKQINTDKDFKKKSGVGKYIYPFPERGELDKDANGDTFNTDTLENYIENYNSAEKETLKAYGKKAWTEMFPSREELGSSKHGGVWQYNVPTDSDVAIIQKKADDYTQKAITQAILGSESDFDSAWDKIQDDLKKMDIEKADKGMTKIVQDTMKLWND